MTKVPSPVGPSPQDAATDIASRCLFMRVRQLDRIISRIFSDALRDSPLPGPQLTLAVAIALREEATPQQLAADLGIEKSSLSRNLDQLEKSGILVSHLSDGGRRMAVSLTDAGHRALLDVWPKWEAAQSLVEAATSELLPSAVNKSLRGLKAST